LLIVSRLASKISRQRRSSPKKRAAMLRRVSPRCTTKMIGSGGGGGGSGRSAPSGFRSPTNSSRSTKIKPKFSVSDNRLISLSVGRNTRFQFPLPDVSRPPLRSGQFSGTEKQFVRATTLASQAHDQLALTLTASSLRMNPGGRPCLERISSQPSLESTTFSRTPFAILATSAESSVGSLKTWVARTV